MSRRTPGRLWAHNDSGPPVLVALDTQGTVTARVRLTGIAIDDWEALAVGPCRQGSCLYAGDIGDNDAERTGVSVYRFPEPPESADSVAVTDVFHATYPDGAHDAETLLVTDDGTLVIVTKGATGAIALYRFPRTLRTGATHRLERVGTGRDDAKVAGRERITDGAVSTDGRWIVLRTTRVLTLHRAGALLGGDWRAVGRVDLADLDEPQGEGVAIGRAGTVYLAGEGGGKSRPGTFARLICSALR